MPKMSLTNVIYDAQHRGFRAVAFIGNERHSCFWPGPAHASFARVTRGLANRALAQQG